MDAPSPEVFKAVGFLLGFLFATWMPSRKRGE